MPSVQLSVYFTKLYLYNLEDTHDWRENMEEMRPQMKE